MTLDNKEICSYSTSKAKWPRDLLRKRHQPQSEPQQYITLMSLCHFGMGSRWLSYSPSTLINLLDDAVEVLRTYYSR